jgi:hypothetical protein
MGKDYFLKKRMCLLFVVIFATVSAFCAPALIPNQIQVSGIISPSDANGVYVKQGLLKANTTGTPDYSNYYWQLTSGSHTYYLYIHQYSTVSYFWNIDDNLSDGSVLFYNSDNSGNGYQVDAVNNGPLNAPVSPDLVTGWINTYGTGIGTPVVQIAPVVPTVNTSVVSNIGTTTATGNGIITDLGYPTSVISYGVCWNTTGGRVVENKTDIGTTSTTGAFTVDLAGLTPNTTYYIRAFATNATGISYGEVQTFTTNAAAGLDEAYLNALTLYPNPTINGFYVDVQDVNATVSVFDLSGSLLLTQQAFGKTYFDITALKQGVYIVKITTSNGTVTKKIAKK